MKDEALAEVAALRKELAEATAEITRLEALEVELSTNVEQQQSRLLDVEMALVEAQTEARRVPALEQITEELRAELATMNEEVKEKSVAESKLTGETAALRKQVSELMTLLRVPPQK